MSFYLCFHLLIYFCLTQLPCKQNSENISRLQHLLSSLSHFKPVLSTVAYPPRSSIKLGGENYFGLIASRGSATAIHPGPCTLPASVTAFMAKPPHPAATLPVPLAPTKPPSPFSNKGGPLLWWKKALIEIAH